MIQINNQDKPQRKHVKAVGLISGGLDSTVAAKVVKDLGVEVYGVYFAMPWGCCDKQKAREACEKIGIPLIVLQLDERYLEMIRNPKFGYGRALNPCVDCRIHMFSRAADYMRSIEADFVFTGEVLGQRPMSQKRHSMKWIEESTGLEGRLLRPLCAQLLEPTIPEETGLIDRSKLLRLNGRGRREQMQLAEAAGIKDYPNPAGGCLLTDQNFANRMKDTLEFGYRNFRETVALQWGRHFRYDRKYKIVIGRDEKENDSLKAYAHPDDYLFELETNDGPTAILKGPDPDENMLQITAGLVQRFSKYRDNGPMDVLCWPAKDRNKIKNIQTKMIEEKELEGMRV